MHIVEQLQNRARAICARIVLPEAEDPRVLEAAAKLVESEIVQPILIGDSSHITSICLQHQIALPSSISIITPTSFGRFDDCVDLLYALRKSNGISRDEAHEQMQASLIFAATMLRMGEADGCVAGAVHATSQVLRCGLQIIGMEEGAQIASSCFLMVLPNGRSLTYADCGMVPYPDADQLAQIAVTSAQTHRQLTGEEPIVAMLSFSTKGSAKHESITKIQEATALAQQMAPDLAIDGELQFDAAYVKAVGDKKAPGSPVVGQANVFIFPNLDAGNIAYKVTERLGGAQALGPIIQGLAKPMHDLSRGCQADDIVTMSAIGAIQSNG